MELNKYWNDIIGERIGHISDVCGYKLIPSMIPDIGHPQSAKYCSTA
jgi:hypothetical protein